jgi:hypothetical protein
METFLIHQANDIQGNKQQQILMMMVNASKFSYISNNFYVISKRITMFNKNNILRGWADEKSKTQPPKPMLIISCIVCFHQLIVMCLRYICF